MDPNEYARKGFGSRYCSLESKRVWYFKNKIFKMYFTFFSGLYRFN